MARPGAARAIVLNHATGAIVWARVRAGVALCAFAGRVDVVGLAHHDGRREHQLPRAFAVRNQCGVARREIELAGQI